MSEIPEKKYKTSEAQRRANKKWRDANKEKQLLASKKWVENNKEKYKTYQKGYADNNKEKIVLLHRQWYLKKKSKKAVEKLTRSLNSLKA